MDRLKIAGLFMRDRRAASAIEYAVLCFLVALAILFGVTETGSGIEAVLSTIDNIVSNAVSASTGPTIIFGYVAQTSNIGSEESTPYLNPYGLFPISGGTPQEQLLMRTVDDQNGLIVYASGYAYSCSPATAENAMADNCNMYDVNIPIGQPSTDQGATFTLYNTGYMMTVAQQNLANQANLGITASKFQYDCQNGTYPGADTGILSTHPGNFVEEPDGSYVCYGMTYSEYRGLSYVTGQAGMQSNIVTY